MMSMYMCWGGDISGHNILFLMSMCMQGGGVISGENILFFMGMYMGWRRGYIRGKCLVLHRFARFAVYEYYISVGR